MANGKKYIKFLSEAYCGAAHDYAILKSELPPEKRIWFDEHQLPVDLGYLGIYKDYSAQQISIPFKKSKNKPLTEDHKIINKQRSSVRVKVEHSIGGLKRFRFYRIVYAVEIFNCITSSHVFVPDYETFA